MNDQHKTSGAPINWGLIGVVGLSAEAWLLLAVLILIAVHRL